MLGRTRYGCHANLLGSRIWLSILFESRTVERLPGLRRQTEAEKLLKFHRITGKLLALFLERISTEGRNPKAFAGVYLIVARRDR